MTLLIVLCGALTHSFAQELSDSASSIPQLVAKGTAAYSDGAFETSLNFYQRALSNGSQDQTVAYNAACCASLVGKPDTAFKFLDQAIEMGWADAAHLARDEDLVSLHTDARWPAINKRIRAMVAHEKNRWSSRKFVSPFRENLSQAEKAAGLSKLWAEVKFNFVNFRSVPELDWDAEYMNYLPQVLASDSTLEYYRLLEEMVAKLKDGHTNVFFPEELRKFNARPGIQTLLIEDKIIVVKILDRELKSMIEIGSELTQINGTSAKEYAKQNIEKYVAGSTIQDRNRKTYGTSLLRGPVGKSIEVELVDPQGKRKTHRLERKDDGNRLMRFFVRKPAFEFRLLDGNLAYVKLNSFATNQASREFAKSFEEISNADGLILDLRENGGGNSGVGWEILSFLTDKPFPTTRWHTLQYRPTYRAWNRQALSRLGNSGQIYSADSKFHFRKPVMMLVGTNTFSAAEDMAAAFDMLGRGKIIGRPTGGSTGQPLMFPLPGGGTGRVCTKRDSYADGTEFVGIGIQPDIVVDQTINDIKNSFDRVLDVATKELMNN